MGDQMTRWMMSALCALVGLAAVPAPLHAQDEVSPGLVRARDTRATVYVRDRSGAESKGRLLELSSDSLVLLVNGDERRVALGDISRVEKRDSLKNGFLIGAVVGVAMGLLSAGISDCPGDDPGGSCPVARAALALIGPPVYGALGAGIDALIPGRTALYTAPAGGTSRGTSGAPRPARVALRVTW